MGKTTLLNAICLLICGFGLTNSSCLSAQNGFANYITLSNGRFWDGSTPFFPLCINYLVDYYPDDDDPVGYYISPHGNYSSKWGYPDNHPSQGRFCFGEDYNLNFLHERDSAIIKLENDLQVMDSLGFNVIRLRPVISWKHNFLQIPTDSYNTYFELQDSLIAQCARHNLRVVLVLGADSFCYKQFDQYCAYLDSVSTHYSHNKAVMAYVVLAEPFYIWNRNKVNDKLYISNWARKWYYLIKKNAPDQLVSYGIQDPVTVINWDPSALTCDFFSMHFYYEDSTVNVANKAIHSYFKWMNSNVSDVWIMGETGYSGTNEEPGHQDAVTGNETQQYQFADYVMRKSLECGCRGFSWWQYQDVRWCSDHPYFQEHLGIRNHYPKRTFKSVTSLFPSYSSLIYQENHCLKPSTYYNIPGHPHANISGVVKDPNNNPIPDAVVVAWSQDWKKIYKTFSNAQGEFTIYTQNGIKIPRIVISHKGYSATKINRDTNNIVTFYPALLYHINYNGWMKNWTISDYSDDLFYPIITDNNIIVVGNFYGDEAEELLLVDASNHSAILYSFLTNHWNYIWSGEFSGWTIRDFDHFSSGDFDGDGYDELLCWQNTNGAWVSIYGFDEQNLNHPWIYEWTNMGSGNIGTWQIQAGDVLLPGHFNDDSHCSLLCIRKQNSPKALCQELYLSAWNTVWSSSLSIGGCWNISNVDKYYVGDFNGDGYDELLCTQVTNGNTDWMSLLHYGSSWSTLWCNNGISEGVGIYPYRNHLNIGNFDPDDADEILGTSTWATKFDLNSSNNWDWSWSTYESRYLSDWYVRPNDRVFFFKTMPFVPDYLFVVSSYLGFSLNGYSFNPN